MAFRFSLPKQQVRSCVAFVKADQLAKFLEKVQEQKNNDSMMKLLGVEQLSQANKDKFCVGTYSRCTKPVECDVCYQLGTGNYRLPCGVCCCTECLRVCITENFKQLEKIRPTFASNADRLLWCPCVGNCDKQMIPSLVDAVLAGVCGLCGKSNGKLNGVGCSHNHKFCLTCLSGSIQRQITEKQLVACPRFSECHYHVPTVAVHSVLDRHLRSMRLLKDCSAKALQLVVTKRVFAQDTIKRAVEDDPFQRVCPSPGCSAVVDVPNVAKLQLVTPHPCPCPKCKRKWCSVCWSLAHPRMKCSEARDATAEWRQFLKIHESACGPQFRDQVALHERQKKQAAETGKSTRRCPHCKRGPIFRIDGCPIMTCGKDAPDKDGALRYIGCGKLFNWDRDAGHDPSLPFALPYNINVQFKPPVEPELLEVQKFGTHGRSCSSCNEIVRGTMFRCTHCSNTMLCWACTRQMICCSPETLDRNTELSPDLAAFVASGDVSAKDALQMMPELLSRHVEHTFQVIQPKFLRGVVVTAVKSPPVALLCSGKTTHVVFGHAKLDVGSTWSYAVNEHGQPVDFRKGKHLTEVYRLATVELNGRFCKSNMTMEVSQLSTALHLKALSAIVFGEKPFSDAIGVLRVPGGGAFIKDHCRISEFYGVSAPDKFTLKYDILTKADALKYIGSNWKNLVAATHDFKVWGGDRGNTNPYHTYYRY